MDDFNSDSDEGEFQMDDASDEPRAGRKGNAADDEGMTGGWIQWYCSLEGHEYLIEVEKDYIRDPFNLYGL